MYRGRYTPVTMEKEKRNLLFYLNHIEEIVIVAMFIAMVLIIFIQVIMRYVFNNSLVWSEELGKFLFVWISWMGISLGERVGEHIKITLLVTKLKWKAAKICNIASLLVVIVICAVTCRYGVLLVVTQATTHYAGIKISMAWAICPW